MASTTPGGSSTSAPTTAIPLPVLIALRGIGQVFFQENALSGLLFILGIAFSSPLMALGGLVGAVLGPLVAWLLQFDRDELKAGIYGFNATLVGIASLFFFQPGLISILFLLAGCVIATVLTRAMRTGLPFPTYTTPFIVTTWALFLVGQSLGIPRTGDADLTPLLANPPLSFVAEATAHGIGQVMFQGSLWTGLLFLLGIAVSNREHAGWVLLGSLIGMVLASYHVTAGLNAIDPERLIERTHFDTIQLGLYGYNATLAPVALFLWRRSLLAPLLGIVLTVPLTEFIPLLGIPALTAPFVLATWIVLVLGWLESKWLAGNSAAS